VILPTTKPAVSAASFEVEDMARCVGLAGIAELARRDQEIHR
jgi:hypothetical protein